MYISHSNALEQLKQSGNVFTELFSHGSLNVEIYRPGKEDLQQPHTRDEVYVIIAGKGQFINGDATTGFSAGDFLFVPAGRPHRFINFTDDFCTWVLFYGPEGGEKQKNV